jgi:kynurenine formamidase
MAFTEFRDWLETLHAQQRFGPGDRAGTANLIDAAARARGVASLTTGEPVSLARALPPDPAITAGGKPGLTLEVELELLADPVAMATDHVEIDCHGLHSTHVDALNHMGRSGTWYGGYALDDQAAPSIADLVDAGLVTRGVFADIPAVRGTEWVDGDEPVTGADLDAAMTAAGVTFEPGDALLLRMGRDAWEAAGNVYASMLADPPPPGIGGSGAEWIADHDVSILGWDFLDTFHASEPPGAVHSLIWAIGLVLIDNCDHGAARAALTAAGKATGLLVVAPLRIPGGTGCTVNPLLLI